MKYAQPTTTQEAMTYLAGDEWLIVSGGTDFYPALGDKSPAGNVLDVSQISSLRSIYADNTHWHIGALATWTDVINTELPASFDALKLAAQEVGSVQIQNRATVVGNICKASPAADGIPALLCLDAIVRISSQDQVRDVALIDFVKGNRKTTLAPGEMVIDLLLPKTSTSGFSHFLKLGARKYLVISIAMVATRLCVDSKNQITDAALSVGSCSVVAQRLPALEQQLIGKTLGRGLVETVTQELVSGLTPINDVRATADYRHDAALELLKRSIESLMNRAS